MKLQNTLKNTGTTEHTEYTKKDDYKTSVFSVYSVVKKSRHGSYE